ncbi:MAG: hypothetical protein B7Y25_02515 [Alphaproteobacteria bacterium 16-39-46]|nr:MAG: hypothetical protein B7Y25_02515 [Alphaproteobacteria bacterium 16-39-46]OZA43626.1 MAG: hypothetical protein B7X84_02630 [Alphaproteobacteria bacterium 17-39-52]HQS83786.1 hypothetical protein [Alphaproteobacteria bacterium]HQS93609.1 hypothetical protein [Alphaproteobacteria bacterium]
MNFVKIRGLFFLVTLSLGVSFFQRVHSEPPLSIQNVQSSLEKLNKLLTEKSENLLKRREETEQILAALLEFSRPSVQKSLLFSSSQDYTRISLLLENLAQKGQEALLDLNQEIAELNMLRELKKKQEKELLEKA